MDIVFVLYRFINDDDSKLNCFQMTLPSENKVILLLDLLQAWENVRHPLLDPSKKQYSFYSITGATKTHLSPAW